MREQRIVIGHSVEGREIVLWKTETERCAPRTLLIGGMHGDEFATITLLEAYRARERSTASVAILPLANPDGLELRSRYNARGVDLNRNCEFNWRSESVEPSGPEPWSEPESRALREFILEYRPSKIVSLHWALAEVEADGPQSEPLAEAMWSAMNAAQRLPYRLRLSKGGGGQRRRELRDVECPGSFGQWCGFMLEYPDGTPPVMVTLELPADPDAERGEEMPDDHLERLHERYRRDAAGYLRTVEPGVFAMLDAACLLHA